MKTLAYVTLALAAGCLLGAERVRAQEAYTLNVSVVATPETAAAASALQSTVAAAAWEAGIAAASGDNGGALFETTIRVSTLSSRVVRTPEPRVVVEVQFDFDSKQVATSRSHGMLSASARGIGRSESDAFLAAVRSQSDLSKRLVAYFHAVERDITRYFGESCTSITQKAMSTADQGNYQAALYALSQVPPGAQTCWTQAQDLMAVVVERTTKQQCASYLVQAKAQWSASRSRESAQAVADALSQFYPGTQCDAEVDLLLADVARTIAAHDRQAADRYRQQREEAVRMYNDRLADRRLHDERSYQLAKAQIEAQREVGSAIAKTWARTNPSWLLAFL